MVESFISRSRIVEYREMGARNNSVGSTIVPYEYYLVLCIVNRYDNCLGQKVYGTKGIGTLRCKQKKSIATDASKIPSKKLTSLSMQVCYG